MNDSRVIIGEESYILDPRGRGEYALPASLQDHLEAQLPTSEEALPGYIPEYSSNWRQEQAVRDGTEFCLMPSCPKPHKTKGKFCSYRHERAYQARRYRRRQQGIQRWVEVVNGKAVRFERKFPSSAQLAKRLFAEHIAQGVCQFASSQGVCPSSNNPHGNPSKPRCLIYATLADDLLVFTARHRGYVIERRYTTPDGMWKEYMNDAAQWLEVSQMWQPKQST